MKKVVSFGGDFNRELPKDYIHKCMGSNSRVLNAYKKGDLDTLLVLSDDYMIVGMPGRKMPGELKQVKDLLTFVKGNFILREDDSYWFGVRDYSEQSEIVFECSTGIIFLYSKELGKIVVNKNHYDFHGSINELEKRFLAFLGWALMSNVPLKQITIYPKDNYCFNLQYLNADNKAYYVGFREAVFHDGMSDSESFKMLCGYEEKKEEYVMGILL